MFLLNHIKLKDKHYILFSVIALSSLAFYLRLMKLFYHKLWADEYYQLGQMKGTFLEMIRGFPSNEFCSYLSGDYYLIYPFFKIFSYNKWGLALPHIISTLLGFYFLYLICRRYFNAIWGYIITFSIVCFNATMIYHATEIRTYAVLPTLALGCLYFWIKLIDSNYYLNKFTKLGIGAFFTVSILFHAYGILIFTFTGLYALAVNMRDKSFPKILRNTVSFTFFVACAAMPIWYLSIFGPHLSSIKYNIYTFEHIPNPLENSIGFLKAIFGNLVGYKKLYFLLFGVILPFLIPCRDRFKQIALLVILVFMPLGVIFWITILTRYWFIQRLFIWVIPFFALFIGWSWDSAILYFQEKLGKLRIANNVKKY